MSIRLRFTSALAAIGLLLFSSYALWSYGSERDDLRAAATAELLVIGQSLETALGNALRDKQRADVDEMLATLESLAPALDIFIHDATGAPIARSSGALMHPSIEQRITEAHGAPTKWIAFDPVDDPVRLIFTGPLTTDDGRSLGMVTLVRPIADLTADLARTRNRLLLATITFLVSTIGAGLALGALYVTRPIARLLHGVRQVREGDFRARVRPGREDEVGKLVHEFNAMIATLADTRARSEAEAEARSRLELGLQRVDKLVTIGQLSAGLAHEIGSPLQVLSGRASALLDHSDLEVQRQAGLLVAQCERITRVIELLLSFGRRKPAIIDACDLVEPVLAIIDLLSGEARRLGIRLTLETGPGPHEIVGDLDQLQQIALNLVRNALAATPRGGSVTVRVDRTEDHVRLAVRDTGQGIDSTTRAKLFDPFFTTRASEGGSGLGLAVVRAIAREHRATIDVVSEPGAGAAFVVAFPRRTEGSRA